MTLDPKAREALEAAKERLGFPPDMATILSEIFDAGRAHQRIIDAAICRRGDGEFTHQQNEVCEDLALAIEAQP